MRKTAIIGLLIAGLLFSDAAYAHWMGGRNGYGKQFAQTTNIDNLKKFQKETLTLRDEIVTKNFELRNEYARTNPDYNKIATLQKEIIDLQAKLSEAVDKYGITGLSHMGGMQGFGMMGYGTMGSHMMSSNLCW